MRIHGSDDDGRRETPPAREPSLEETLGIEDDYAPEDLAPPIDRERIAALIARRLSGGDEEEVLALIATFRSWHDARVALRRASFGSSQQPD